MEAIMGRKEKALLIAIGANLFLVALKFFLAGVSGSIPQIFPGWSFRQYGPPDERLAFGPGTVCILGGFRWFYAFPKGRKSTHQRN
jgi:hypothetical protein